MPGRYPVLAPLSRCYPRRRDRSLTCYSPVRRSPITLAGHRSARLACVKHAASVRPEPGSNSPVTYPQPRPRFSPRRTRRLPPRSGLSYFRPCGCTASRRAWPTPFSPFALFSFQGAQHRPPQSAARSPGSAYRRPRAATPQLRRQKRGPTASLPQPASPAAGGYSSRC
jgi:hypothetical protein